MARKIFELLVKLGHLPATAGGGLKSKCTTMVVKVVWRDLVLVRTVFHWRC